MAPLRPTIPLSQVARIVGGLFESELVRDLWVEATLVSMTVASSGHWYLQLREGEVSMRGACWRSYAQRLRRPTEGTVIHLHGRIEFYGARGEVTFIIDDIREQDADAQALELERLIAHYATLARPRPLPLFPRRIGVVTSRTGAALQDVRSTLTERYPCVEVVLAHSTVQGAGAPSEIEAALELLYGEALDVILVVRGGGASEDLAAFNSEIVAKAVLRSPIPVISGVGHEVDTTLIDVVADRRAATPTYAAAAATPDRREVIQHLVNLRYTMQQRLAARTTAYEMQLDDASGRLLRAAPAQRITTLQQQLGYAHNRLRRAMAQIVAHHTALLERNAARLDALDPAAVLERGYTIVRDNAGHVVRAAHETSPNQPLSIQFADGVVAVTTAGAAHD